MNYRDPKLGTRLAAEYALGTMGGLARRRFEGLMAADPWLRREVRAWQDDLYGIVELIPERTPPERLWTHIETRLWPVATGRVVPLAPKARPSRLWQVWSGLATAAALLLAVAVWRAPAPPSPQPLAVPDYVAVVSDRDGRPAWLVRPAPGGGLAVSALAPQALASDRAFELWLLPPGGAAPKSLGLLPADGGARLGVAPERLREIVEGDGLAVSLEPAGGSPTGAPTGPVLYLGKPLPRV